MKWRTGKRILSILLTLAMVMGLMPGMSVTALATEYTGGYVALSELQVGDKIGTGVEYLTGPDNYSVTLLADGYGMDMGGWYDTESNDRNFYSSEFSYGKFQSQYLPMYKGQNNSVQLSDYWYVIAINHESKTITLSGDQNAEVDEIIGTEIKSNINENTIYAGDCTITATNGIWVGSNSKVVLTINGNLYVNKPLLVCKGSYVIVNGNLTFNKRSKLTCYDNAKIIYTGNLSNNTSWGFGNNLIKPNIQGNITYHAASGSDPEYFTFGTSDTKYFLDGNQFRSVTAVSLDKTTAQTIDVDGKVAFTATVQPVNATDKTVKWSVGGTNPDAVKLYSDKACNTEVGTAATETLTVYAKGISAGSATVTCTSNAESTKSAKCDVTVNAVEPVSHIHDEITFAEWTSTTSLPTEAGNYYLTTNVTLDGWIVPTGGITRLCLNGKTVTISDLVEINSDATLDLYDEGENGKIIKADEVSSIGIQVGNDGTFNMHGGTISGFLTGVEVSGAFNMHGGKISGNTTGVDISEGSFTMTGGTITSNMNNGVVVGADDTFNVSGAPSITNNSDGCNVYLESGAKITVANVLTNTTPIGVTMETPGTFTSGWSTYMNDIPPANYFTSDNGDYEVQAKENESALTVLYPLWVGGTQVTSANAADVFGDGKVSFAPATTGENATPAILSLNGASITSEDFYFNAGIYYTGNDDLKIILAGSNSISITDESLYGIDSLVGSVTIEEMTAGACLNISVKSWGISAPKVIISSGTVNVNSESDRAINGGNIEISGGTVTAACKSVAISGTVKNTIAGTGWTNTEGTEGRADIAISETGQNLLSYKKVQFPAAAKETPVVGDFIFTAPTNLAYNGTAKFANVVAKEGINGMGNVTVQYYSDAARTEDVERPTNAGTYYVGITVAEGDNYTATTSVLHDPDWKFTISNADAVAATVTANNRTYDGTDQALVTADESTLVGGTMQYALGNDDENVPTDGWSESIPTGKKFGTYYVWYKVVGNENYNGTKPVCLADIEIAKREAVLEWSDTSMVYNGEPQLPTVAIKNKVEGDEVSAILTGGSTDAGYFEVTVAGLEGRDADNYAVPKNNSKVCSIAKAAPVVSVSMPNRTYGDAVTEPTVTGVPVGKTAIIEYKSIDANAYTTTAPVNAGKYKVRATLKGDNNYETVTAVYNFVIYPKEVTLTWGETEFIFNGKDQVPSVTVSGFVGEDILMADVAGAATAVGTHTATVLSLNGKAADNYKLPVDTRKTFTIIKAELPDDEGANPAKLTMPGWTYGDSAPDPVIENNIGGGTVNFSYAKDTVAEGGEDTLDYVNGKPSEAGSYIVKAEIGATENYEAAVRYARFVIRPREAVVEWGDTAFVYDGQEHKPSCEVTNLVNSDKCEVTVSVDGDTSAVGEYIATVSGLSNENYALSGPTATVFTVSKDRPALSVSMTGWIYGDEANSPIVDGNTGNAQATYTYYTDEALKEETGKVDGAATVGGKPSYAGNYYVEAVTEATAGYESGRAVAGFTIGKRNLDIGWMDISYTYDGKSHVPSVDALNKVTGDELILTVGGAAVDAGDYEASVEITGASVSNYNLPAITTQRFGISKRVAGFEWGETQFVYNGSDQVPSVRMTNLVENDVCDITVVGAATEVGEHTATVTRLSNTNYELPEDVSTGFSIAKADVATDINVSDKPAILTIPDWTYGDSAPEPVLENNIGGGTVTFGYAAVSGNEVPAAYGNLEYSTVKPKDAGIYVVRADIGATESYNSAVLYKSFSIAPKVARLKWTQTSIVYDGETHVPECVVSNLEYGDECEVEISGGGSGAGEYEVKAQSLSNPNYALPEIVTQTLKISKDVPELTVAMEGWTYGDEANDPVVEGNDGGSEVSYSYYTDEAMTKLTGKAQGAVAEGGVPAYSGTYYVKAIAPAMDNYESVSANAAFAIEKRLLSFEWNDLVFTYDGKEHLALATPVNAVAGDDLTVVISGKGKDAGDYEAVIEGIEGDRIDNYLLPEVLTQPFKITKKVAELKWGDTQFTYTGKDQIPTVSVNNLVKGDVCELTVTGAATAVGTHTATVIRLSNANYELPEAAEQEFTIAKADLDEDAKVIISGWTYGESPSVPRVEGNIEGANVTFQYKPEGAKDSEYTTTVPSDAGSYVVSAIIDGTAGYNGKPVTAGFKIAKADSEIDIAPKAVRGIIYDADAHELVTEGKAIGGTLKYTVLDDSVNAPGADEYTEAIPSQTLSGTYYVWYKVFGDDNHKDSAVDMLEVSITPVTREALIETIGDVTGYYDEIRAVKDYAEIAKDLKDVIDDAKAVADDDNVTDEQIGQALKALMDEREEAALRVQDVDDTKAAKAVADKINALPAPGQITIHDEKAITDAKAAYDELTDPQEAKIDDATRKKLDDALTALDKAFEPIRKMEESNRKRDRLVEIINSKGFDTVQGIYQTPYDTVSMNYTVVKGKITQVSFDIKSLKDGDNYMTVNTGIRMILSDKFTVVDNFANKRDYRKVSKAIKLKDYGYVLDVKKLKGRSTYEMILVSADGNKRLIMDVVDLSLNKKALKKTVLTTPVKEAEVGAKAVSENKISDVGFAENGGVVTITSAPVLKSEINPRKTRSARFISGVWMVGNTAVAYGKTQTVTKGKVTVYAKVNSDGTLSIGKAEGSGKGSMPITYILNGKVSVKHGNVKMKSKTYKTRIKVK